MANLIRAVLLLLAFALPASAQQEQDAFDAALSGLAGSFNQQTEAVERLGALGDPRAVPALRALGEGRLLKRPDGAGVVPPGEAAPPEAGAETVRPDAAVKAPMVPAGTGGFAVAPKFRPTVPRLAALTSSGTSTPSVQLLFAVGVKERFTMCCRPSES